MTETIIAMHLPRFCISIKLLILKLFCKAKETIYALVAGPTESSSESEEYQSISVAYALKNYGNSILRVSYTYLHNIDDAEDILQDTLIQLIRTRPVFENAKHEKAWLMRVAINLSKNKIKSLNFRRTDELTENYPCTDEDDLSFVWEAVSKLPVKYREVIHLFYHEAYSTAEIASLLKKNESTIRSLLYRARNILKETLKGEYDFEE